MDKTPLTIYRTLCTLIKHKIFHVNEVGGKVYNSHILDQGDVPLGSINPVTNKFEVCDNHRGRAYSARKRLKYRKNKKKDQ